MEMGIVGFGLVVVVGGSGCRDDSAKGVRGEV